MHVPLLIFASLLAIVTVWLFIARVLVRPFKRTDARAHEMADAAFGFILVDSFVVAVGFVATFATGEEHANMFFDGFYGIVSVALMLVSAAIAIFAWRHARQLRAEEKGRRAEEATAQAETIANAKASLEY